jgi:hypothetical protein
MASEINIGLQLLIPVITTCSFQESRFVRYNNSASYSSTRKCVLDNALF